jgi:hypothetical protein
MTVFIGGTLAQQRRTGTCNAIDISFRFDRWPINYNIKCSSNFNHIFRVMAFPFPK